MDIYIYVGEFGSELVRSMDLICKYIYICRSGVDNVSKVQICFEVPVKCLYFVGYLDLGLFSFEAGILWIHIWLYMTMFERSSEGILMKQWWLIEDIDDLDPPQWVFWGVYPSGDAWSGSEVISHIMYACILVFGVILVFLKHSKTWSWPSTKWESRPMKGGIET